MTEALVALVVVLLAGCGYLAYRHRAERGIESGISSFRRELRALAPRRDADDGPTTGSSPRIVHDPARPPGAPADTDLDAGADDGDVSGPDR